MAKKNPDDYIIFINTIKFQYIQTLKSVTADLQWKVNVPMVLNLNKL
jgi:hypothetical protein